MTQSAPITLTQYGRMAEKHWREFRPNMVKQMEATGELQAMLYDAQEKTKDEMADLTQKLIRQNYTPDQAHRTAWEMVRERYILLTPENLPA
jgi:ornithine cyclodeaminase/alanine dehydrogenase-like protein (mu-crystallin family)